MKRRAKRNLRGSRGVRGSAPEIRIPCEQVRYEIRNRAAASRLAFAGDCNSTRRYAPILNRYLRRGFAGWSAGGGESVPLASA
jgi:hypothetical protein